MLMKHLDERGPAKARARREAGAPQRRVVYVLPLRFRLIPNRAPSKQRAPRGRAERAIRTRPPRASSIPTARAPTRPGVERLTMRDWARRPLAARYSPEPLGGNDVYPGQSRKTGRSWASPGWCNFTRKEHSRDQKTFFSICCFVSHSGCSIWARTGSSAAHTTAGSSNRKSHFCQPKQDVHNAQRHINRCRRENA